MAQGGYRVGVDVGGTFTDLICITPDGQVVLDKTPTGCAGVRGVEEARRALEAELGHRGSRGAPGVRATTPGAGRTVCANMPPWLPTARFCVSCRA